jgi:aryl-alcohol dehydrogenase-like predicted oxidoreductase
VLYTTLGKTEFEVSRICFGTLTMGPLQKNYSIAQGVEILKQATENGINFFDTAELYETYPYLNGLLKAVKKPVIIASKSYAYTFEGMMDSIEKARREIDRDYIDIFLMHEQESALTIKGHYPAWEALLAAKEKGIVKAIGVSTHHVQGVSAAKELAGIDVIHPIINYKGLGIVDGTVEEMLQEIKNARAKGIGMYGMKALGGGNLSGNYLEALQYVFAIKELDAVALGMQELSEIQANCMILKGTNLPKELHMELLKHDKRLRIESWCSSCGECIKKCSQNALSFNDFQELKVQHEKCILCGYCSTVCADFCIKVY